MQFDDAILMAFADGELSSAEAARIEAALSENPELAARVERFRSVRAALRKVYDSVAAEPIPEHLRALLGDVASKEPAPVASIEAARRRRMLGPLSAPTWAAIAATLIVGVLAGRLTAPSPENLLVAEAGHLRAGAELTQALDTRLASEPGNAEAATRIGVSFRTSSGEMCRTFLHIEAGEGLSGLACRDVRGWDVRIAESNQAVTGEYQQAGVAAPAVLAMVDALIDGEPFDQAQERRARDRNWRD